MTSRDEIGEVLLAQAKTELGYGALRQPSQSTQTGHCPVRATAPTTEVVVPNLFKVVFGIIAACFEPLPTYSEGSTDVPESSLRCCYCGSTQDVDPMSRECSHCE